MSVVLWLVMPATGRCSVVQFAAPAGSLPAGHLHGAMYDEVLPSGRLVTPLGDSVVTGVNAFGFALSPDGRFAIVSNDDPHDEHVPSAVDSRIFSGYSLAVVDLTTLRVTDRYGLSGETYFAGVAVVRDPTVPDRNLIFAAGGPTDAVYVFDLNPSGELSLDARHVIPIAGPTEPEFTNFGHSFPTTLVAAPDGAHVYAVDQGGDGVTVIDTAARTAGAISQVGFFPFGAAIVKDRLFVTNEGLMRYRRVMPAPFAPPFVAPPADLLRASSLSFVELTSSGDFTALSQPGESIAAPGLALDPAPDGTRIVGGAHPTSIVVTPDENFAFVAMTNVDRIATVALTGRAQVVGGTELRLFDRGPYGTQPAALAVSHDGTRLYVALAGLNAVAVLDARDPVHLHRLGLLPTGWFPSALTLSDDDRTLYVLNTKGFNDSGAVWSTLQKIDLSALPLSATTVTALRNTRQIRAAQPHYPPALTNVVVIVEQNKTLNAMLGDLGLGPSDTGQQYLDAGLTPNLHALARRFGIAGNFYADGQESSAEHQFLIGGSASVFSQRTPLDATGRRPPDTTNADPEEYPRPGYIFNTLARHHISFRDYGDSVGLTGYDDGGAADPTDDDPGFAAIDDRFAPTHGLGGRYTADAPGLAALAGHIDLDYPGWNIRIRDERRAREFIRDYAALVRQHRQPRFTDIWLPADETEAGSASLPIVEPIVDGDRALGMIVAYLSRLESWKHTAIFVLPDAAQDSHDQIAGQRIYAIVVSPFAKPHYVGMHHLSTVSVLKTAEEILGIPPLALGDLLATDMSDFVRPQADVRPFTALGVMPQTTGGQ